ncbi:DUF4269 domain-containing protein [Tenacibaculum caenipelagi]|uniref:Uncharacterized protein DUF4269 n=1 Tax=Tenacibaculum caenipelagi TaxID=1325435 RepID=A0A4V3D3A2_9FLAO|nr:DUF4269 domain-containing protein [Tenacibaculum caenipelagi]TDQ28794.1 uncharacterized protein DUF4269 [Tenacibaculum caenipelagi]
MINFKDISYLKRGTSRQKEAYKVLIELDFFEFLKEFNPILVGTIPIDIDLESSDLDIVCQSENHEEFIKIVSEKYGELSGFEVKTIPSYKNLKTIIVTFKYKTFPIEIFVQNKPSEQQDSYLHMLIEYEVLLEKDKEFKSKIIALKKQGVKTEPAFAKLLGLEGNPYEALLNYGLEKGYIF